jgi:hypothetical protein
VATWSRDVLKGRGSTWGAGRCASRSTWAATLAPRVPQALGRLVQRPWHLPLAALSSVIAPQCFLNKIHPPLCSSPLRSGTHSPVPGSQCSRKATSFQFLHSVLSLLGAFAPVPSVETLFPSRLSNFYQMSSA